VLPEFDLLGVGSPNVDLNYLLVIDSVRVSGYRIRPHCTTYEHERYDRQRTDH